MPTTFTFTIASLAAAADDGTLTPEELNGATAIRDLALDPDTEDLMLSDGDLVFNYGNEAIASDIASRCRTFGPGVGDDGVALEGEYFLDTSIGVDFWGKVFRGSVNEADARDAFAVEIAKTPGVLEVRNIVSDITDREFTLSFDAVSNLGALISIVLSDAREE